MTTCKQIYARFEALEERLAHCYFTLHERFITNPPLARFWAAIETLGLTHYAYHPCDEPMLKHVQYRPGFYSRDKEGKEYELVLW